MAAACGREALSLSWEFGAVSQSGSQSGSPSGELKQTPLHALHHELGARMVPFAGYKMAVRYHDGIMKEHRHTRNAAGLFDVSHMGQVRISCAGGGSGGSGGGSGGIIINKLGALENKYLRLKGTAGNPQSHDGGTEYSGPRNVPNAPGG